MAKDKNPGFLDILGGGRKQTGRGVSEVQTKPEAELHEAKEPLAIVEQQTGLLERVLKDGSDDPEEAKTDLATLNGILTRLSQKTVVVIFAMGKILAQVKATLPHGDFMPWVEANCPCTRMSCARYMRIYERYKNEPRRALEELSITEAYIEAGIKRLGLPELPERGQFAGGSPSDGLPTLEDYKSLFKNQPASGVPLKRYRVVTYKDGKIYALSPEQGMIVPVVNLYVNQAINQEDYQAAVVQAHKDVCLALEAFYYRLEQLEDQGAVQRPFDVRMGSMMRTSRNVTPPKKAGSPKPSSAKKGGKK